jgi:hypothetical protein
LTDILASQWLAKIGKAQNGMNETHHKSKLKHLNYWSGKFDEVLIKRSKLHYSLFECKVQCEGGQNCSGKGR